MNNMSLTAEQREQILREIRGFYANSFFHIFINGDFNPDISLISSSKNQGTVQHEYTHYIQNIGTLWGMYSSIFMYEKIIALRKYISANKDINRPVKFPLDEHLQKKANYVKFGNGTTGYYDFKIDQSKSIDVKSNLVTVNGEQKEGVLVSVTDTEGKRHDINLGAFIIKESMAALYQSLLDPDAPHKDVPYNLVLIIAQKKYPQTAEDIRKLICCCHASLFNMNPGLQLIQLLDEAEQHPETNGFELFSNYVHTKNVKTRNGVVPMIDFYNNMIDGFLYKLQKNIKAPIDYINSALERTRLSGSYYPFLSVLYESEYSAKSLSEIIGHYGIPYIQTTSGYHYPEGKLEENKNGSTDVLELIVQEAIFTMLNRGTLEFCPLYYMCSGTSLEKKECFGEPWKGNICAFKIVSDSWDLNNKNIL